MKLEQQVCNLALAKRLKKLGVKQESLFNWSDEGPPGIPNYKVEYRSHTSSKGNENVEYYSAFTVAELGEMLPVSYKKEDEKIWRVYQFNDKKEFGLEYQLNRNDGIIEKLITSYEKTEADARAKILIHLIENKLIKC